MAVLPNPNLPRVDPYLENPETFAHIDILWVTSIVDQFNTAMQALEADLVDINTRLNNGGL